MKRAMSMGSLWVAGAVCLVALGGMASTASADLRLDTLSSTGATTLAIPTSSNGQWSITGVQLWFNVTTGTDPAQNAASRFFYSVYSSNSNNTGDGVNRTSLIVTSPSHGDLEVYEHVSHANNTCHVSLVWTPAS